MSARQELHSYISRIERRLRLGTLLRGAAILTSAALGATVVVVILANARAFSGGSVAGGRLILFCILAAAAAFGLAIPISRLSRRRAVSQAELRFPEFQQRLVTFMDKDDSEPFLDLLAADTLDVASGAEPAALAPNTTLLAMAGAGVGAMGVLLWLTWPDQDSWVMARTCCGPDRDGAAPRTTCRSAPATRSSAATPINCHRANRRAAVAARCAVCALQSTSKWEPVVMQPRAAQQVTSSCSRACRRTWIRRSGREELTAFQYPRRRSPSVKQIKVTYHYPDWTGLKT